MKVYRIGRAHDNDIIVNDARVSSYHAELAVNESGSAILTDFSTNGTMVNGQLILHSSVPVQITDAIYFPGNVPLDVVRYIQVIDVPVPKQPLYAPRSMSMGEAIRSVFDKYATFTGRARRSEYWFWMLFYYLILMIPFVGWFVWPLVAFLPSLAVAVRRLHDTNHSGWFLLLNMIPLVNIIVLVWLCTDSDPGQNEYGPNPKYN